MATSLIEDRAPGGFSFENCYRNERLEKSGLTLPKAVKTGTTICGVVFKGHVGAALVLGGVDFSGPHLYSVAPHGSSDKLPYVTMGSGSLAAMSVLESRYRFGMDQAEAMKLVRDAIASGIFNDLGSGSNVDLCVITKDDVKYLRPYEVANKKGERAAKYNPPVGSTAVLSKTCEKVEFDVVTTRVVRDMPDPMADRMDTS